MGHDDARKVTPEEIALWCDDLRHSKNISGRTVSQKYLAAAKVVFAIAMEKRKLTVNPAAGARVRYSKPQRTRSPGFTDAEAKTILKAALAHPDTLGRRSDLSKRAIRWGPWICAFTGARIGEVMQLRSEDSLKWWMVRRCHASASRPRLEPSRRDASGSCPFTRSCKTWDWSR